ncbi:MAG: YbjN domain-containing protein [Kofleriaceae bacterium]|nr:YbjN domain-containing protein [Kofleriaceae bacterium]MCL4224873.1 YbjN domain-containing protein [Myxococcales bacterium]
MGLSLFENSREINTSSTVMMVEDVLIALGHFVNDCRVDEPPATRAWRVTKGSAQVSIQILERDDHPHLRVTSAVMCLATDAAPGVRAELHADLLARNLDLCGLAFAARGDQVVLVAERSTLDLDRSEVLELIKRVSDHADAVDNALVATYGGQMGGTC